MPAQFLSKAVLLALLFSPAVHAEIRLPQILSNHAVLQRNVPIHIWGWATPGAHLMVHFDKQVQPAVADEAGEWSAWLTPVSAGGPYTLTVDGDGTVTRDDILVGDVWLASGQSNMQFPLKGFDSAPLKNGAAEIARASHPRIRLLLVPLVAADFPQSDVKATWTECTPETAVDFSAVAYFFGREISEKEDVPVGLIDSSWGGTPADSWVSMDTLGTDVNLLPAFHARALFGDQEVRRGEIEEINRAKRAAGLPLPAPGWHPNQVSWRPAALYNAMIAPLTPYSIRGFLWYQGETNSGEDRYLNYGELFPALIRDWRERFGQGDLPFIYAQISSFISPEEHWGVVRDAQRRALGLRNTAMAVTIDVGNPKNVHPADKQTVGARMALAARGMVYGEKVEFRSPEFREVTNEPGALRVWFDDAAGLNSRGPLTAFEVAGENHQFFRATARVEGESVVVSSPTVPWPKYVRYGWDNAATGSLYNAAGLPVGTFTSEVAPKF
ncbi:9-O-acetylesterase [Edaphobacter acidisoli]|uniref:9-O-acetylesterase n=1 Tax=Edaphobacter acidisoli TaxID=2040573 RepID=A0A916RQJ7_9BACT|nr:sialate O-acetylesterase [Edaphobacter acidisoli]GGA66411.1 9-O-acetylesterase [Edaphobacter acidisoli]